MKVYITCRRKADYDEMRAEMKEFKQDFVARDHTEIPVEDMYEEFANNTQHLMDKYIPTKMFRGNGNHPWVSDHTKRLIRRRDQAFIKARWGNINAKSKFKGLKQLIQKKSRQDYNK